MVASITTPEGSPRQTGPEYCTPLEGTGGDGVCYGGIYGSAYLLQLVALRRAKVPQEEVDTLSVRVAPGTQRTRTTGCTPEHEFVSTKKVLIDRPCPADAAQRCGDVCIRTVLEKYQPQTQPSA